jgi:hypothetical protein
VLKITNEQRQNELRSLMKKLEELAFKAEGYRDRLNLSEDERKRWSSIALDLRLAAQMSSNLVDPL